MIAALTIAAAYGCAHDDPVLTGTSRSNSTKGGQDNGDPNAEDGPEGDPNDPGGGDPGGSDDSDSGAQNDSGTKQGGGATCIDPAASPDDGHHNAGQDCISCHQSVASANWTIAGTLYGGANGGSGVSGATIEITDANGQTIDLVSSDNGNFYTDQNVAFPVHVRASSCPADTSMVSAAQQGSCNAGGCHASGNRIHL